MNEPFRKKSSKMYLNKSLDEQDYFKFWEGSISSEEDMQLNKIPEVLWSRNGYLFQYQEEHDGFADLSGRTLSSCSWHNDEFDIKSASKVSESLEAIDDALYDQIQSPHLNSEVFQECCDWAERFPYLRVRGKQVLPHKESLVHSANARVTNFENSFSSLQLEGRKVPIHSSNKSKELNSDCISYNDMPGETVEEESGEFLVLHKCEDNGGSAIEINPQEDAKAGTSLVALEEKIIDKLVEEVWPKVLAFLDNLACRNDISHSVQLPPIAVAAEQNRAFHLQRPHTEGSNVLSTEFPKLENILSVSPKVLQQRDPGISCHTRPNSEISLNHRTSSKSSKFASDRTIENSIHPKFACGLSERLCNVENPVLVLPSLEEHFHESSSMLRGFHIEPCKKLLPKTVFTSRNEIESIRENEYFLPPIVDKTLPSNLKLTKNLFAFYGAPVISNKAKNCGTAKKFKSKSRPSTSISKQTTNNADRKLLAKKDVSLNSRSNNYVSRNISSQMFQEIPVQKSSSNESSQEKSVTLFPIVTPLTPHEEKNHSTRKGLLHSFLGAKKR